MFFVDIILLPQINSSNKIQRVLKISLIKIGFPSVFSYFPDSKKKSIILGLNMGISTEI